MNVSVAAACEQPSVARGRGPVSPQPAYRRRRSPAEKADTVTQTLVVKENGQWVSG